MIRACGERVRTVRPTSRSDAPTAANAWSRAAVEQFAQGVADHRQHPQKRRCGGGEQQWHVTDIVAADRDGDQALGAVECVDLWRSTVLTLAQHVGRRRTGVGDVAQGVPQPFGDKVRIVAGRSAGSDR